MGWAEWLMVAVLVVLAAGILRHLRAGAAAGQWSVGVMADDKVTLFLMHRRVTVSRIAENKGYGYPDNPYTSKDSPRDFEVVREATDEEMRASEQKRQADTDSAIEQLQMQAAVDRRVEQLRMQAAVDRRVEQLVGRVGGSMADDTATKGAAPAPTADPLPPPAPRSTIKVQEGPPRTIVAYIQGRLRDETRLFAESVGAEFHDLTNDAHGYFQLIFDLWAKGDPFIVIEQDVLPHDQQFSAMVACPEPWCAGVHKLRDDAPEIWSMGLMKFGADVLSQRYSQLYTGEVEADGAQQLANRLGENRHYSRVDLALYGVLSQRGFEKPHLHGPAGRHIR